MSCDFQCEGCKRLAKAEEDLSTERAEVVRLTRACRLASGLLRPGAKGFPTLFMRDARKILDDALAAAARVAGKE